MPEFARESAALRVPLRIPAGGAGAAAARVRSALARDMGRDRTVRVTATALLVLLLLLLLLLRVRPLVLRLSMMVSVRRLPSRGLLLVVPVSRSGVGLGMGRGRWRPVCCGTLSLALALTLAPALLLLRQLRRSVPLTPTPVVVVAVAPTRVIIPPSPLLLLLVLVRALVVAAVMPVIGGVLLSVSMPLMVVRGGPTVHTNTAPSVAAPIAVRLLGSAHGFRICVQFRPFILLPTIIRHHARRQVVRLQQRPHFGRRDARRDKLHRGKAREEMRYGVSATEKRHTARTTSATRIRHGEHSG